MGKSDSTANEKRNDRRGRPRPCENSKNFLATPKIGYLIPFAGRRSSRTRDSGRSILSMHFSNDVFTQPRPIVDFQESQLELTECLQTRHPLAGRSQGSKQYRATRFALRRSTNCSLLTLYCVFVPFESRPVSHSASCDLNRARHPSGSSVSR